MQVVEPTVAHLGFRLLDGTLRNRSCGQSQTARRKRTVGASGLRRSALQRPEIHDGLIVTPRTTHIELRLRQFSERALSGRGVDRKVDIEKPRQHPENIAVEHGAGSVVSGRADGRGGIVADAPQRADLVVRPGKHASEPLRDLPRRSVQVARTAVIAEPLPCLEHLVLRSGGQRPDVGKALREAQVIVHALRDAGLLEDNLGEPYAVRIAGASPRQIAAVPGVPVQQYVGNVVHILSAKVAIFPFRLYI